MFLSRAAIASLLLAVAGCDSALSSDARSGSDGSHPGLDKESKRYAAYDQIHAGNVGRLEIAWRRPAVDRQLAAAFPEMRVSPYLKATPAYIDGVLYSPNGIGLVEAFDPVTGATLWVQDLPAADELQAQSTRGIAYWRDGADERLLVVRGPYLYALDRLTGEVVPDFGSAGRVDLIPPGSRSFGSSSLIVVGDVVVVSGAVDGAGDSGDQWRGSAPEDIRGYSASTGEHLWTFHVVPREGEFGTDTWGNESWRESGDLGSWCCLTADEELGFVYVPLSAPTAAYYGGHRPGDNLYSNTLVALDAATGERVWHFQTVHHDLWEYDLVGPPILGRITVDGREIHAVMQASKTAFLYVFDRETGEPVWPIEERPVPQSDVPGEHTSPTQPFPTKPAPFDRQGVTADDLMDFTPELRARALAIADSFVIGPLFTPPSVVSEEPGGKKGTLMVPGSWGGANWNTGAFDPETGTYYAFSHVYPRVFRLKKAVDPASEMDYWSPNRDAPYVDGLPLIKPPYGRLTAIDMNRGEHLWMVANGEGPRDHPLLRDLDLPPLGVPGRPVALVTRTLLFLGEGSESMSGMGPDKAGNMFRAYDKATGTVIWETELAAGTTSAPMSYMHEGSQYVIVAIGGREVAPEWIAFRLP